MCGYLIFFFFLEIEKIMPYPSSSFPPIGGNGAAAWTRATAVVTAIVMVAASTTGAVAAAAVVAKEMANAKQTVGGGKNSTINCQKEKTNKNKWQ